jgi:hypothetical protein
MTFWSSIITMEARVNFIRDYFWWLTAYQLKQAAALPYGALPEFVVRSAVRLACFDRMYEGPKFQ